MVDKTAAFHSSVIWGSPYQEMGAQVSMEMTQEVCYFQNNLQGQKGSGQWTKVGEKLLKDAWHVFWGEKSAF